MLVSMMIESIFYEDGYYSNHKRDGGSNSDSDYDTNGCDDPNDLKFSDINRLDNLRKNEFGDDYLAVIVMRVKVLGLIDKSRGKQGVPEWYQVAIT